jgi:hypothetical protein
MEIDGNYSKEPIFKLDFYGYKDIFKCRTTNCIHNNHEECDLYKEQGEDHAIDYNSKQFIHIHKREWEYTVDLDDEGKIIKFDCHSFINRWGAQQIKSSMNRRRVDEQSILF